MAGLPLAGQAALVTGASRGIGRACALALAAQGARLALVARDAAALERVAAEIRALAAGGDRTAAVPIAADVAGEGAAARAFEEAERELVAPVTVLVSNAGTVEQVAPVAGLSAEAWSRTLEVNLTAGFLFAREAVRRMVPRGQGRIIFVSSISATLGSPRMAAYCASKWGLNGLIKSLAEELRGTGVLALGVSPGSVDTEMLRKSGFPADMSPQDVATVVRFLATEAPAAMQGSIVEMFG